MTMNDNKVQKYVSKEIFKNKCDLKVEYLRGNLTGGIICIDAHFFICF